MTTTTLETLTQTADFATTGDPQQLIYLMGISFVLGSLVTIFLLVILEMIRAARNEYVATHEMEDGDDEEYEVDEFDEHDEDAPYVP